MKQHRKQDDKYFDALNNMSLSDNLKALRGDDKKIFIDEELAEIHYATLNILFKEFIKELKEEIKHNIKMKDGITGFELSIDKLAGKELSE